jgi:hypothetical protein
MTAVAKLATIWNIPIIGYVSSDGFLDNKLIYRTLARISMSASNGITDAVVALLRHFEWQRVRNIQKTASNKLDQDITRSVRASKL